MMTVTQSFEGEICTDCVVLIATGDHSGMSEQDYGAWCRRVAAHDPTENGRYDVIVGFTDEVWFSKQRCDYCNQTLAGDRYQATWMERSRARP